MRPSWEIIAPLVTALVAALVLAFWGLHSRAVPADWRVPLDHPAAVIDTGAHGAGPPVPQLALGPGEPGRDRGQWPGFRGPDGAGWIEPTAELARGWPSDGPRRVWHRDMGEGYAAPAVWDGRVYLIDYDAEAQADALRCLSLDDGREIWRKSYSVRIKRSHGMSRTVPAVADGVVVSIGPRCHVLAVDAITGQLKWFIDMVRQFDTTVPPWYAGQCPLIDDGRVILAPAGPEVLMTAVDLHSGDTLWTTPNPMGWSMTHVSITPMELDGRRMYIYCGSGGVAGVDARTGELLWHTDAWRVPIATIASPVVVGPGLVLFSGGYNAGSMLMRISTDAPQYGEHDDASDNGEKPREVFFKTETVWRLPAEQFGATQQTPIYRDGHLFGIRPDGQLVCLNLNGQIVWASGPRVRFGIGPLLIAGDLIYLMDDHGRLTIAELSTQAYRPLATARVLDGHESWGPMALAGDRLLVRDLTALRCLDVGTRP
ncbi:MAG: PQQ-like beta-propeller repeat protein [Phycisphaeraceae bacterium]|nr:PQQ-like beta-propeller repeat protein [Phycisphaeraceae bacterium]